MKIENGFTMVELLIVLLIVGIVAGVAVPRVQSYVAYHQNETARFMVVQQLREAKSLAIGRNVSVDWVLTTNQSSKMVTVDDNIPLSNAELICPRDPNITYTLSGFTAPANAIRFNNRGSVINIDLVNKKVGTITIQGHGRSVSFFVDGTGKTGLFK